MTAWRGIAVAAFLFVTAGAHAAGLSVMAEDAAEPFSGRDGSGYADDVVKAAFHAAGADVSLDVVPYARCKNSVEAGKTVACFSMSWDAGMAGKVALSRHPISQVYADLFLPGAAGKDDAVLGSGAVVGVINDYEYPDSIYKLRERGLVLQAAPDDYANLNMLAHGRLDGAIVMTNDLEPAARKAIAAGVGRKVHVGTRFGIEQSYIGFSLVHPRGAWARDQFDIGFDKITRDGTLAAIRKKWLLRLNPPAAGAR
jgi:ABC-type amino acid transport substrate-binding protein